MRLRSAPVFLLLLALSATAAFPQRIQVTQVGPNYLPGWIDSNSPTWWQDGVLHVVTSAGAPLLGKGPNQFEWSDVGMADTQLMNHTPFWLESVWRDPDGVLFGWYHHEPGGICPKLTAPKIGAAYSTDEGATWRDLGIVLESGDPPNCTATNGYFAGGHGDFSVVVDRFNRYLYFFFGNYAGDGASQGIAMARLSTADRWGQQGAVWKYHEGRWTEPGLGGRVTPVFRAAVDWQQPNTDSFWGPSIHWNTYLQSYVILMNRSCCAPGWPQEGIYATFNRDLSRPGGWSEPVEILNATFRPGWYPEAVGLGPGETDRLIGRRARFYIAGVSYWELEFIRTAPFAGPNGR